MATPAETVALDLMASAVETLRVQMQTNWSSEDRRDHLKAALVLVMTGAAALVREAHELADPEYLPTDHIGVMVDHAFHDAVESEERAAPNYVPTIRTHGTPHMVQGATL